MNDSALGFVTVTPRPGTVQTEAMIAVPPRFPSGVFASVLLGVVLLASGCAVGPDFHRPAGPADAGYAPQPMQGSTAGSSGVAGGPQTFVTGEDVQARWWAAFGSPALNSLVDEALRANPSIAAAQATLRQAQELVYAQQGFFYPTVQASYQFERQKLAGNLGGNSPGIQGNGSVISTTQNPAGPPYTEPVTYNFHTAQLTVGYAPDVFGLNRRQVESLDAQAKYQRFELEATTLTLAANVVGAAIQEASVRAQIAATKRIIALNQQSLDITRDKQTYGYAMGIDVAAEETALAEARETLPPLEKQLEQTRDLLRALLGKLPNAELAQTFELSALTLPQHLPLSLPSKIVEQRPDVRAAEQQLRSANAEVGVAVANRLPQFSITGAVGGTASEFNQLFRTGGPFWNIIGSATQTLFDGNTLLHQQRAAEQALKQAAAQYQSTVIGAYQNVADTLHALYADADTVAAAVAAEQAARASLDLTIQRNQAGYYDFLTVLAAEAAYQQALLASIQAEATRFGDTAALYQALGGGWWNGDEMAASRQP